MFLFLLFLLRHRTGGFHFRTFICCYIGSLILFGAVCIGCKILINHNWILLSLTLLSSLLIMFLGTVNNPNMNKEEHKAARSSSRQCLC
ncbi:MAG: accessory gene regulator B family protein [Lachnospiraceae bacterium]|nr:accessory gene regulator B family protein [Lachnospiraceae bacterium]